MEQMGGQFSPELSAEQADAEKSRRRRLAWATAILLIGLPVYLVVASVIVGQLTEPVIVDGQVIAHRSIHWVLELLVYIALGLIWAFPLKRLVTGLGKR